MKLNLLVEEPIIDRPLNRSIINYSIEDSDKDTLFLTNSYHIEDALSLPNAIRVDDPAIECVLTKDNLKRPEERNILIKGYLSTKVVKKYPHVHELNLRVLLILLNQQSKADNKAILSILGSWANICQKQPSKIASTLKQVPLEDLADDELTLVKKFLTDISRMNEIVIEPVKFLVQIHLRHLRSKSSELNLEEDEHGLYVMLNQPHTIYDQLLFYCLIQKSEHTVIDTNAYESYVTDAMELSNGNLVIATTDLSEKDWKDKALNTAEDFIQQASGNTKLFLAYVESKSKECLDEITMQQWQHCMDSQSLSSVLSSYLTLEDNKIKRLIWNNDNYEAVDLVFADDDKNEQDKELLLKSISDKFDELQKNLVQDEQETEKEEDNNDLSFWSNEVDLESQGFRDTMISSLEDAK